MNKPKDVTISRRDLRQLLHWASKGIQKTESGPENAIENIKKYNKLTNNGIRVCDLKYGQSLCLK